MRNRSLSGSTPSAVICTSGFWLRHADFVAIVAAAAVIAVLAAPDMYVLRGEWGWFLVVIQFVAIWGTVITARAFAILDVNLDLLNELQMRGTAYYAEGQRANVDEIEVQLLANWSTLPDAAPVRLVRQACSDARHRQFDSPADVAQRYRAELQGDVFGLLQLQKIGLWLATLGTLFGLLLAFRSGTIDDLHNSSELTTFVKTLTAGLHFTISSSVAGLEVAVLIGFFVLLLRRYHEPYLVRLECASATLLTLMRAVTNVYDRHVTLSDPEFSVPEFLPPFPSIRT